PLRYGVQFSAAEEYVQLVERAKALLSHAHSKSTLEEIHLRAMRLLVAELEKRRFGAAAPRREAAQGAGSVRESSETSASSDSNDSNDSNDPSDSNDSNEPGELSASSASNASNEPRAARQRGRYIPAAVRREVFERDAARCTFVDSAGQRCREAHRLDLHHLRPFAQGGEHKASNLALRCRAHNALSAEQDFGRDFVENKRARRHEPFGSG